MQPGAPSITNMWETEGYAQRIGEIELDGKRDLILIYLELRIERGEITIGLLGIWSFSSLGVCLGL